MTDGGCDGDHQEPWIDGWATASAWGRGGAGALHMALNNTWMCRAGPARPSCGAPARWTRRRVILRDECECEPCFFLSAVSISSWRSRDKVGRGHQLAHARGAVRPAPPTPQPRLTLAFNPLAFTLSAAKGFATLDRAPSNFAAAPCTQCAPMVPLQLPPARQCADARSQEGLHPT